MLTRVKNARLLFITGSNNVVQPTLYRAVNNICPITILSQPALPSHLPFAIFIKNTTSSLNGINICCATIALGRGGGGGGGGGYIKRKNKLAEFFTSQNSPQSSVFFKIYFAWVVPAMSFELSFNQS